MKTGTPARSTPEPTLTGLSKQTLQGVASLGVRSISELAAFSERELRGKKDVLGWQEVDELKQFLADRGYRFRVDSSNSILDQPVTDLELSVRSRKALSGSKYLHTR